MAVAGEAEFHDLASAEAWADQDAGSLLPRAGDPHPDPIREAERCVSAMLEIRELARARASLSGFREDREEAAGLDERLPLRVTSPDAVGDLEVRLLERTR